MQEFEHILNWTLKQGSHAFPGPDGGTCINEAAIVAAGFPYRRVRRAEDMPACFSRPICHLAMHLNDNAGDAERQRLMPYVTRLACADEAEVERRRERFIRERMGARVEFERGLTILEGALAIGRRAEAPEAAEIGTRFEEARGPAPRLTPRRGLLAKLTTWSWGKKALEEA